MQGITGDSLFKDGGGGGGEGGRVSEKGSLIRNQYWQGDAGYHRRFAF